MLKPSASEAFFTDGGYLSMNRECLKKLIGRDQKIIVIEGVKFNVNKLACNISFNEHKLVIRWRPEHFNKCKIKGN